MLNIFFSRTIKIGEIKFQEIIWDFVSGLRLRGILLCKKAENTENKHFFF